MKKYYIVSGLEGVKIINGNKIDGLCGIMVAFSNKRKAEKYRNKRYAKQKRPAILQATV